MSTLPNDVARCVGVGSDEEGWREGCEMCLRRTSPLPPDSYRSVWIEPPPIITFFCESLIEPETDKTDVVERLRAELDCVHSSRRKRVAALIDEAAAEITRLRAEVTRLEAEKAKAVKVAERHRVGHERYELVRRMAPIQFHALWDANIVTGKPFDQLVDELKPFAAMRGDRDDG